MMSDLKDRLLEEKLIVILRGLAEEKLIATVDPEKYGYALF